MSHILSWLRRFRSGSTGRLDAIDERLARMEKVMAAGHEARCLADWRAELASLEGRGHLPLYAYGWRAYCQNDEDGIIAEVFRRIGAGDGVFVEFGIGDGLTNNTLALLADGWNGVWIDRAERARRNIQQWFDPLCRSGALTYLHRSITAENITALFREASVPATFDLLSVDIDGNDYWVWLALREYRPRVVVIEYNAGMGPCLEWVMRYDAEARWAGTRYHGASLRSLERLGSDLGYRLVGCNFSGVNAFFVRDDVVGDAFPGPHSAEHHHRPLILGWTLPQGHPTDPREVASFRDERPGRSTESLRSGGGRQHRLSA